MSIPEDQAITAIDAEAHELIGPVATGCAGGDLIALTLWLIAERAKGPQSSYASLVSSIPVMVGTECGKRVEPLNIFDMYSLSNAEPVKQPTLVV